MISMSDLAKFSRLRGDELNYALRFHRAEFDFDVFLPKRRMNLQRGLVWTLEQKQEFIMSIFYDRMMMPFAVNLNHKNKKDTMEVIDGKQRLTTYYSYLDNQFKLESGEYFTELTREHQTHLIYWQPRFLRRIDLTEDQKVEWFVWLNYHSTPMDKEHLNMLVSA